MKEDDQKFDHLCWTYPILMVIVMKKNVGSTERVIRIVVGVSILSLFFIGPQSPWALLGIVPLLTGVLGWCPPYAVMGISTCCKNKGTGDGKSCCSS